MVDGGPRVPQHEVDASEAVPLGPAFEEAPILTRFLDQTEEQIRSRLAKLRLFERVFLLERDWMTRITMLMLIAGLFWGAVGGFDAFGFQSQVIAYTSGTTLHLSDQEIYSSLTLHGIRELFGLTQQVEMAIFGVLAVNALGIVPRHKWTLYLSVGLLNASMLLFEGPVYLAPFNDNYFPAIGWYFLSPLGVAGQSAYVVSPLWFLGWVALSAALLIWTAWMVAQLQAWRLSQAGAAWRRFPVFMWFVVGGLVLIPITYVPLLISTLWDMGTAYAGWAISPLANQVIFWMFGHSIVYVLFLLPLVVLYFLIPLLARRPVYSYRFAVASGILFVILTPLLGIHHLYLTPLPALSVWLTMALSFAIIIPSAITVFSLWMTLKGVPAHQWEWNAAALFALLSLGGVIFGGLTGPTLATVPWDVDVHNSLYVVSHFHAIVILAIVAGAFAFLYAAFPILTGRQWFSARLAQVHFLFTLVGGVLLVLMFDQLGDLGVLRRAVIMPLVPAITLYQLWLFIGIVVILVGQLFLVLNGFLTVFRGALFSAAGLTFDEAVRKAAQSTAPTSSRVPVADIPFHRGISRARRERAEKLWVGSVVVLLVLVLAAATPASFSTSNGIASPGDYPAGTEFVTLVGQQYYWAAQESGAVEGSFDNAVVAYAGQWVNLNLTATGATQSVLIPFRSIAPVNVQVVPGSTSHALFQAPSIPGVYGAPDGEYDGPWFGQDVSALIVLPSTTTAATLAAFQGNGAEGDLYSPPVYPAATASLVANGEGLFNYSVPGPTLEAPAGAVAFSWSVPLSSIGISNYLVNVTSTDPNAQQEYVVAHNGTLPYRFGIYAIASPTGLVPVTQGALVIGPTVTEHATLTAGVYLYGLVSPVSYSYDPSGESSTGTGSDTGFVMGLWGVLWVDP
ncbi:MAG TPA: cbb3-type cytochrome c oxidase subunit I [Thermoplasmata archaeon]|nr:cbb3-type cytochrome c oxidase subunit I [Thermoplasmata archaeon]